MFLKCKNEGAQEKKILSKGKNGKKRRVATKILCFDERFTISFFKNLQNKKSGIILLETFL